MKKCCQIVATKGLNPSKSQQNQAFPGFRNHSHSANSDIWECIWGDFMGKKFANMLMFYPLFEATHFLSIKIVSQKRRKSNLFRPNTAPKTPLILRGVLVEISLELRLISTTAWERLRSQATGRLISASAEINPTMGRNSTTGTAQNQKRRASTFGACPP